MNALTSLLNLPAHPINDAAYTERCRLQLADSAALVLRGEIRKNSRSHHLFRALVDVKAEVLLR